MSRSLVKNRIAGAAALAVALWASESDACGPGGTYSPTYGAPATGSVVAANIPAIAIVPGQLYGSPCTVGLIELLDAAQQSVALTPSANEPHVHLLSQELIPPGSFTLRFEEICTGGQGLVTTHEQTFISRPSSPQPISTGKLKLLEQGKTYLSSSDGYCTWPGGDAAWVRVQLRPACDLVPFLPVAKFVASVDGTAWASSRFGSPDNPSIGATANHHIDFVFAACSASFGSPYPLSGTSEGKHVLSVRAEIAGSDAQLAPAELAIDLSCNSAELEPSWSAGNRLDIAGACAPEPDGDSGAAGAPVVDGAAGAPIIDGAAGAPGVDGAAAASGGENATPPRSLEAGGGCSLRSRPSPARALHTYLAVLALLLRRRRPRTAP